MCDIHCFANFFYQIVKTPFFPWIPSLIPLLQTFSVEAAVDSQWKRQWGIVQQLPTLSPDDLDLQRTVLADSKKKLPDSERHRIEHLLRGLIPWRKGPFMLYGIHVNAEWRSDWKWSRLASHLEPLEGRSVLDVGCGSGYYLWRILGAGACFVVGVDPIKTFYAQFEAVKKLIGSPSGVHFLPLPFERLPVLGQFDTVFSMGVLYHRSSPLDHLEQLKGQLRCQGELVLESLVIEGDVGQLLMPIERYAKMRNVYFIPSMLLLELWLVKVGFCDIKRISVSETTLQEQRATDWSRGESLINFLDGDKTVEGYRRPLRAIFLAKKRCGNCLNCSTN